MKKTLLMLLSVVALTAFVSVKKANAQDKKEQWPGVNVKVLAENENLKVMEMTFAPGAVADWHSHPLHSVYAVTDIKMQTEEKDKDATTTEVKAGEGKISPAVTHKVTNVGKTAFTAIVTEIKQIPHVH